MRLPASLAACPAWRWQRCSISQDPSPSRPGPRAVQSSITQLHSARDEAQEQDRRSLEQSASAHAAQLAQLQGELAGLKGERYGQVRPWV